MWIVIPIFDFNKTFGYLELMFSIEKCSAKVLVAIGVKKRSHPKKKKGVQLLLDAQLKHRTSDRQGKDSVGRISSLSDVRSN